MTIYFVFSCHIETVVLLSKLYEAKHHIEAKLDMDEIDITKGEGKASSKAIH